MIMLMIIIVASYRSAQVRHSVTLMVLQHYCPTVHGHFISFPLNHLSYFESIQTVLPSMQGTKLMQRQNHLSPHRYRFKPG